MITAAILLKVTLNTTTLIPKPEQWNRS